MPTTTRNVPGSPTPPPPSSRPYLHAIDRTDRGKRRYELTSFFATPGALAALLRDIQTHFAHKLPTVDAIIGIDALGLVMASAFAAVVEKPVVCARKRGKLPMSDDEVLRTPGFRDYMAEEVGEKGLEVRKDLVKEGMKVIVMDEWVDTGSQMSSLVRLLESAGAEVVGIATLHLRRGRSEAGDALYDGYDCFVADRETEV